MKPDQAPTEDITPLTGIEKLVRIQAELKAPKGQTNNFGNYRYRSAEDILESAKPILNKYGVALTISDKILMLGDRPEEGYTATAEGKVTSKTAIGRVYVEATATLYNRLGDKIAVTTAYAREELSKKGSDASQITGAASSYARKYALNGLFCIDDTKDADSQEPTTDNQPRKK